MNHGNPFRTALLSISIGSIVIGFLSLLIGTTMANQQPATAAGFLAFGASLLPLGGICFLLWLVVSAIGWRPADPSMPAAPSLRSMLDQPKDDWTEEDSL
jgi:hypothetical protein